MQTFLPYPSFSQCAKVLDNKRVQKQLLECTQILDILLNKKSHTCVNCKFTTDEPDIDILLKHCKYITADGVDATTIHKFQKTPWYNHPAVNMWRGYEVSLIQYSHEILLVCNLGRINTAKLTETLAKQYNQISYHGSISPWWLGNDKLHKSHRANLLRKHYDHYKLYFNEDLTIPYWWPTAEEKTLWEKEQRRPLTILLNETL